MEELGYTAYVSKEFYDLHEEQLVEDNLVSRSAALGLRFLLL